MKRSRILMDFLRMGDGALVQKALLIETSMTNNVYFSNPTPSIAELTAVNQEYLVALNAAANRDLVKISLKNAAREKLEAVMVRLANHITAVGDGNRTMYLSTGYTVSAEGKSPVVMGSIQNFTVERGAASGEVLLSLDRPVGAVSFNFYFAIAGEEPMVWQLAESSKTTATLSGLLMGKNYSFYVKAIGSKGKTIQSDIVTKMVS